MPAFRTDDHLFAPVSYYSLHPAKLKNEDLEREAGDFNKGDKFKSDLPLFRQKIVHGPLKVPEDQKHLNFGFYGDTAVGDHLDDRNPGAFKCQ